MVWLGFPAGPFEPIDPDFSTVQPTADKVFRLPGDAGLIRLELQSTRDGSLPDRLLRYNTLLFDRHGGPVRSVAILLRPDADADRLTGRLERRYTGGRWYRRFVYDVVKIWELAAEPLLAGDLGTAPLALLTNDAANRLPELVQRFADRVGREITEEGMRDRLLAGSYILLGLRYDRATIDSLFRGVQSMEESTTYPAILSNGIERGRVEGRVEGKVDGGVEGLKLSLVAFLERKFGGIPPQVESAIRASADEAKLTAAILQLPNLVSPNDLIL